MPRQGAQRAVGGGGGANPGKFEPDVRLEQRKGFPDAKARGNFVGKWEKSSFIEIWNSKLFRKGVIKIKYMRVHPTES